MKIGERIKKVREMTGLSQLVFAEKLGIDRSYISKIEKGNREPSSQLIKLICTTFGINEDWLKNGEGEMLWIPDFPPKEFLKFMGNFEEEGQKGLYHILGKYIYIIDKFTEEIYDYQLGKFKFDNPKPDVLSSKESLEDALEYFKRALDEWFEQMFKKKEE